MLDSRTIIKPKITALVNTYNAEQHLQKVLDAVGDFDEVLVVDMESTDRTVEIARRAGARVVTFPRGQYTIVEPARQFSIDQATHPWVLVVDADEIVTPHLREWCYNHASRPDAEQGVMIPRRNFFMGREMRSLYPDPILRFFRRDGVKWPATIHAIPQVPGRVLRIDPSHRELAFIHLANEGAGERIRKIERYSDREADRRATRRHPVTAMALKSPWLFVRRYLLKGGWHDGHEGLIYALLDAFNEVIINAKIIERTKPGRDRLKY